VSKNRVKFYLQLLLAAFVLLVVARGAAYAANPTSNVSTKPTALQQRVSQRKSSLNTQLTSLQAQILTSKCSPAQDILSKVKSKDNTTAEKRKQTYTELSAKVSSVTDILQKKGIDTTALKNAKDEYNSAANQYLIDSDSYKTAIEDVVSIDCKSDPAGFEATLVSSRQLRAKLATDSSQIKNKISEITKILASAKEELNKKGVNQ
jgi:hypothetical protein